MRDKPWAMMPGMAVPAEIGKTPGLRTNRGSFSQKETPGYAGNVIKLRKAGSHKDVGSSFFVTILEIMLDK